MIIGHTLFAYNIEGIIWDTPIPTDMLNTAMMYGGEYNKLYVDLDTSITDENVKFEGWNAKTIMNADFRGDLNAGSVGVKGFNITHIQFMRSIQYSGEWETVAVFDYDEEYNHYTFVDRYVPNGVTYEYAIAPIANEIVGEKLVSDPILVEYEGVMVTDSENNYRLEFDTSLGALTHNASSTTMSPLNSKYPIVISSTDNYRTGNIKTLPLASDTLKGNEINSLQEKLNRETLVKMLTNGKAKVLRIDNGSVMLVKTGNVQETFRERNLSGLADVTFDFTEIGATNFSNLLNNGLTSGSHLGKVTFDEFGGVVYSE